MDSRALKFSRQTNINTPLGTNISPTKGTVEDDFPFSKVGYVSSLEGTSINYCFTFAGILMDFVLETLAIPHCF